MCPPPLHHPQTAPTTPSQCCHPTAPTTTIVKTPLDLYHETQIVTYKGKFGFVCSYPADQHASLIVKTGDSVIFKYSVTKESVIEQVNDSEIVIGYDHVFTFGYPRICNMFVNMMNTQIHQLKEKS